MAKKSQLIKTNKQRHMIVTPVARISFPNVFTARSYQDSPDQKKSFQVDLLFDSKDVLKEPYKGKKLQTVSVIKAIANAKRDQWGSDKNSWPKFEHPTIKKGDERTNSEGEVYDGYKGKLVISARCGEKFPPKIIGLDGSPLSEQDFYGGCFARAQLVARPYIFGKNNGVRMVLYQLQKTDDGEKFGSSEDCFDLSETENDDWSDEGDDESGDDEF